MTSYYAINIGSNPLRTLTLPDVIQLIILPTLSKRVQGQFEEGINGSVIVSHNGQNILQHTLGTIHC